MEEGWVCWVTVGDGAECAGEEVDFGVALHDVVRDELWVEHASIGDHERDVRENEY